MLIINGETTSAIIIKTGSGRGCPGPALPPLFRENPAFHIPHVFHQFPEFSGFFLWSQFVHKYLLVTIKIRRHIPFKTTVLKGAVKCEGFCSQRTKAWLVRVVSSEEHSNEF